MRRQWEAREVGQILRMKVMLVGPDDIGERYWEMPSGVRVKTADALPILRAWVAALDTERTVDLIAALSAWRHTGPDRVRQELERAGSHDQALFREYQMAFVLKTLLTDTARPPWAGRRITETDLAKMCLMVVHSRCDADVRFESGWAFLQRMAYQQFWEQEDYTSWPRGILIHREMNQRLPEHDRFDINKRFLELHGVDLDSFLFLSFALFALTTQQPGRVFDVAQFVESPDFAISEQQAVTFFDLIGITFEEYRRRAQDPATTERGYELYDLNPLVFWPALKRPSGGHIVPVPRFLLDRATTGIYFDFFQRLDDDEAGRFGNFWGGAFQAYVGELMRGTPNSPQPEEGGMAVPGPGRACDWVVRDRDAILLIECKTRGLSAKSRITGEETYLRRDVARADKGDPRGSSLAGAVVQLMKSRDQLAATGRPRFVCLVVTLDKMYFANNREWLHRFIREEAERKYGGPLPEDFEVTDVAGLERLCRFVAATGASAADVLGEKMGNPEVANLDLMRYVTDLAAGNLPPHPVLDRAADVSLRELVNEFRRTH